MKLRDLLGLPRKRKLPFPAPAPGPLRAQPWTGPSEKVRALGPTPSILVVKLDHIGDFITALPAMERLRTAFPASRLSLLCAPFVAELARSTGLFAQVHEFDFFGARMQEPRLAGDADMVALRALGVPAQDIIIDLRQESEARALLWAIEAKVRVGIAACGPAFPLDLVVPEMELSLRRNGWSLPLGASSRLMLLVEALAAAHRGGGAPQYLLGGAGTVPPGLGDCVILAPGARLDIKKWTLEGWTGLAAAIVRQTGLDVAIIGLQEEAVTATHIAARLPPGRVRDLVGAFSLAELPGVMRAAAGYVGVDTGTTHLAAAVGVPTVAVFSGFAEIRVWAPVGPATTVLHTAAACAPCHIPAVAACPHQRACITAIDAGSVLAALAAISPHPALRALAVSNAQA